jgi:hypothetical protein
MIMTTPWGFQMTAARLVSLVIDGPDGPTRIDIAVHRIRWTPKTRCLLGASCSGVDDSDPNDPRAWQRIAADVAEAATAQPGIRP